MRRYETIFITLPELTEEDQTTLIEKIRSILASWHGDVIKLDDWGARKLSYEIRKNSRWRYFLLDYLAKPDLVRELERNLRLNDRVLKFQTVKISDSVSPEAAQALKEKAAAPEKAAPPSEPLAPPQETATEKPATLEGGEGK